MSKPIVESPWPYYSDEEIEAATGTLRSGKVNYWTGTECRDFENEFAQYHGVGHAIALANGTLALELALRSLGIAPGDEVIVTPRSFFASASCVASVGATPVFADVDRDSQNLSADTIARVVSDRTRAVIPVHLAGWPCDMPEIVELARRHGFAVIEDCAQAHGATIDGRPIGSFGDAAAFSFCQDKIMSTGGEGGMLITDNAAVWQRAWEYKDHGKSLARINEPRKAQGFRWLHESFGSNWRMTEFQAAIGRIQLRRLDEWAAARRRNAAALADSVADISAIRVPLPRQGIAHAFYKFYVFVEPQELAEGWTRDRILEELTAEGIPGLSGSCPEIYREGAFGDRSQPTLKIARRTRRNQYHVHGSSDHHRQRA